MLLANGTVHVSSLRRPRVEPKLAFRLARPLRVDGPEPEVVEPLARSLSSVPALEAVSWLGGRLAEKGLAPGPGTLLVSQTLGGAVVLRAGVRVIAHFSGVGAVQLDASDAAA